jgi:hypothetical protein
LSKRKRRNANAKLRFKLRGGNFGMVPIRSRDQKQKGSIMDVVTSCGCVFCDLDIPSEMHEGKRWHSTPNQSAFGGCEVVLCTNPAALTAASETGVGK